MRTTIHGKHVFECDACGDTLETETKDFNEARQKLRDAEWRARDGGRIP